MKAAARQIKGIRVGYLFKQESNSILAEKCRKPLRYITSRFPVKAPAPAGRTRAIIATLLALLSSVVVGIPGAGAQAEETVPPPELAPFINKVIFVGNENIPEKEIKRNMKTKAPAFYNIFRKPRLDMTVLSRDIAQLEGYYHSAGFFDASVKLERLDYSEDRRFVDIVISISEGQPTVVESVEFSPNSLIAESELRKDLLLQPGEPYNASYLYTDVYTLRSIYFNRGYLAVAIRESVELEEHRASVFFDIEPGTQIKIRSIEISGNVRSNKGVIEKEIAFETGDVCRLSKLVETQRNLYETGLFTVVDISPENLDPLDRTVDIFVRVRERKSRYIEFGFGVGNILGSRMFAEWGTRNLLGTGRGLKLSAEYGYDLFQGESVDFEKIQFRNNFWRYDVEYFQRYIFGWKALMSIDAFVEKDATVQNIIVRRIGGQLLSRRRAGRYADVLLGFSDEFIKRVVLGTVESEGEVRFLTGGLSYDRRDLILNPRSGFYRFLRVKLAGGILGGDYDFYTTSASSQWYWNLFRNDVLALRVRVGFGDSYGQSETVPIEDRFFAGGVNSVRGYENNSLGPKIEENDTEIPTGGNALLLTNLEVRFDIPVLSKINISGSAFFDGGNVWEDFNDVRLSDFRLFPPESEVDINDYFYGMGLGIRYNTPIGPIRLDYGFPLKPDLFREKKGESGKNGIFYLALGQTF